mmetsp:Transcript_92100/g.287124  ORF Transcript_92100/g.287124 Transcript_92100/m.287124 type:complete len:253 (+) Transcript_92100:144-902(+)
MGWACRNHYMLTIMRCSDWTGCVLLLQSKGSGRCATSPPFGESCKLRPTASPWEDRCVIIACNNRECAAAGAVLGRLILPCMESVETEGVNSGGARRTRSRNSSRSISPSPLRSYCGKRTAISAGVSEVMRAISSTLIFPLPSASRTRKAAWTAWSELTSPKWWAAARYSVYSISSEPSVSTESKTFSTHSAMSLVAPGQSRATALASSVRLMRPFLSSSMARNCSWRSAMCWSASCMARAVRKARRSMLLR